MRSLIMPVVWKTSMSINDRRTDVASGRSHIQVFSTLQLQAPRHELKMPGNGNTDTDTDTVQYIQVHNSVTNTNTVRQCSSMPVCRN